MTAGHVPLTKSVKVGFGTSDSQQIIKGGAIPKLAALIQRTFTAAMNRGM